MGKSALSSSFPYAEKQGRAAYAGGGPRRWPGGTRAAGVMGKRERESWWVDSPT